MLPFGQGGFIQDPSEGYRELYPQLSNPAITYGTDLVTVTIGGNDVGFVDVLKHCANPLVGLCNTPEYEAQMNVVIDAVVPDLVASYEAIADRTYGSRLLVLGYPRLFGSTAAEQACPELALFAGEQDFLNRLADRLNERIHQAAMLASVEFVSVAESFAGHEVCGASGAWINGMDFTRATRSWFVDDESFHPNIDGQAAYARVINSVIAGG